MVAGGLPTVQVLLDDGTGTFPYDVTAWARLVEGYKFKRGRQDELSSVVNGDFAVVFDNTDGRFTVGSTIIATPSPIKADQKVRVKVTANATTVNRFTQAVQSWPTEWPDGSDLFAVAAVSGTDPQTAAERRPLRSVPEEEVLLDLPLVYYTLGEPANAATAADSSGNQAPSLTMTGAGADVVFGTATGPGTDGLTAATFAGGKYLSLATPFAGATTTPSLLVVFDLASPPAATAVLATLDAGGSQNFTVSIDPSGILSGFLRGNSGSATSVTTAGSVADGHTHVAEVTYDGSGNLTLYLDGVSVGSVVYAAGVSPLSYLRVGNDQFGLSPFTGTLAHVAAYGTANSAARALAHAQAMLTGFAGESGTARITRLAGYANLPIGTLDTSLTNVAFVDITNKSAMEAIREVADAELGLTYFDGSGNLTFHNRNRAVSKTAPDVTIDANFLAPGTRFEYDMQGVINYFAVMAIGTGVTQIVRNTTSEITNKHGRYPAPGSGNYLVQTDAEALDRANWIVATHAEPAARIGQLVIDVLTMTAAQQAAMLAVEADTWLRVTGLPGQTPGGTTADFIVQGLVETLFASDSDAAWTMTLNAANKPAFFPTPWILGDATYGVLGSTTRLYV